MFGNVQSGKTLMCVDSRSRKCNGINKSTKSENCQTLRRLRSQQFLKFKNPPTTVQPSQGSFSVFPGCGAPLQGKDPLGTLVGTSKPAAHATWRPTPSGESAAPARRRRRPSRRHWRRRRLEADLSEITPPRARDGSAHIDATDCRDAAGTDRGATWGLNSAEHLTHRRTTYTRDRPRPSSTPPNSLGPHTLGHRTTWPMSRFGPAQLNRPASSPHPTPCQVTLRSVMRLRFA